MPTPAPNGKDVFVPEDDVHTESLDRELDEQGTLFLKASEQREREIETVIDEWKNADKLDSYGHFYEQERSHSSLYESMVQRHTLAFEESQRETEIAFEANELRREKEFNEELSKVTRYEEDQRMMEERFRRIMEDLLTTAREREMEQEVAFAGWELSVQTTFRGLLDEWKRKFADDERYWEVCDAQLSSGTVPCESGNNSNIARHEEEK